MSTANANHSQHSEDVHQPQLAHHFDTLEQQYSSAKLGMWAFLATEILMFGGLFCAYAVYRGTHPEVFLYAHHFLNTFWGAFNTVVLIASSLTMAWGVRAAQLGNKPLLVLMLLLTLVGGCSFMVVKYIEYSDKWEHVSHHDSSSFSLFAGSRNAFYTEEGEFTDPTAVGQAVQYGESKQHHDEHATSHTDQVGDLHDASEKTLEHQGKHATEQGHQIVDATVAKTLDFKSVQTRPMPTDHSDIRRPAPAPQGLSEAFEHIGGIPAPYETLAAAGTGHAVVTWEDLDDRQQGLVSQFFQIYFMMTGLHGLHVLIGMGLITWILIRSLRGEFGPSYYTPVDLVGLYWHLVDLIWIFLFPLLYLIH